MKSTDLIHALNDIDPKDLLAAAPGRRKKALPAFLAAAAAVLLAAVLIPFAFAAKDEESAARVYLDVNPSFELEVSKSGAILSVSAENDDAKKVLAGNDALSGENVTVGAILGGILEKGYFSEEKDTVLLSVECENDVLAEELKNGLAEDARRFFSEKFPGGTAIALTLTENEKTDLIAETCGISKGAAAFLIRLVGVREEYTPEYLASLDVSALRRLCEQNGIRTDVRVLTTQPEAMETADRMMRETLGAEPLSTTVYPAGTPGFWRVELQGEKCVAICDIDWETGEIAAEKHAPFPSGAEILDLAIAGAGYTPDRIAHYEILKTEPWIRFYVWLSTMPYDEHAAYVSREIDLTPLTRCRVNLHIKDGPFLAVSLNGSTGEIRSVERTNYTYAIDMLDAVVIALEDAGLPTDEPPLPVCVISEGICELGFDFGGTVYSCRIDAFTGEILSKESTPIAS